MERRRWLSHKPTTHMIRSSKDAARGIELIAHSLPPATLLTHLTPATRSAPNNSAPLSCISIYNVDAAVGLCHGRDFSDLPRISSATIEGASRAQARSHHTETARQCMIIRGGRSDEGERRSQTLVASVAFSKGGCILPCSKILRSPPSRAEEQSDSLLYVPSLFQSAQVPELK